MSFYPCRGGGSKITKTKSVENIYYDEIEKDTFTFATVPGHTYLITLIGLDKIIQSTFNVTGANVLWEEHSHPVPMKDSGITDYASVISATSGIVTLKTSAILQYATFRATELL